VLAEIAGNPIFYMASPIPINRDVGVMRKAPALHPEKKGPIDQSMSPLNRHNGVPNPDESGCCPARVAGCPANGW